MPFIIIFCFALLTTSVGWAEDKAPLIASQSLRTKELKYKVEFYGPAEFCDYASIKIKKDSKVIFTLNDLCGREIKSAAVLSITIKMEI